eukprot:2508832-Prymnesium_polylepis.1
MPAASAASPSDSNATTAADVPPPTSALLLSSSASNLAPQSHPVPRPVDLGFGSAATASRAPSKERTAAQAPAWAEQMLMSALIAALLAEL